MPQQVPALVERDFHGAQSLVLLGLVDLVVLKLATQFLLLGDQLVHLSENVLVRSHSSSLPDYGEAVSATSGQKPEIEFPDGPPPADLVVTDLGMPGMTGLALATEIKARRAAPVVLLTGWADELDADAARGVEAVVAKPFTRELLLGGVARAVPDRVRPE